VILSNHGGRQLDAAVSPLDVLAESRARISAPILVDSGYRRGTDIVKALALGANAVVLGRAPLYGLAAAGEPGVSHVLRLLKDEVDRTLAQIGCASASQLSSDYVMADGPMPTIARTSQKDLYDFVLHGGISPRGREPSAIGTTEEMHHEHS
jgi:(S)-mandelate dehydrogenase